MKKTIWAWTLLSLSAPMLWAQKTYVMNELIQKASERSSAVRSATAQKEQAVAAWQLSKGYALPTLGFQMTAARTDDALQSFGMKVMQRNASFADFGAGEFNPMAGATGLTVKPTALNYPKAQNDWGSSLYIQAPIYTGGQISSARQMARAAIDASEQNIEWQKNNSKFEMLKFRAMLIGAEAYVKVAEQAELTYKDMTVMIVKLSKEGLVQKSDLLGAQVKLDEVRLQKQQALDLKNSTLDQIKALAGLELSEEIKVNTELPEQLELGSCADLSNNQALRAMQGQGRIKEAQIQIQKSKFLPTVGAQAKLESHNPDYPSADAWSYTIGLQADWKIFEGGQTAANTAMARAQKKEWQADFERAKSQMELGCRESQRQIASIQDKINSKDQAIQSAQEALRLVDQRYKEGLANLVEWQAAETQLEKSRAERIAAIQELEMQKNALLLFSGKL